MTTKIKILGVACAKSEQTTIIVKEVVKENNIDASIENIEDILEIEKFKMPSTPAVIINDVVTVKGRVPSKKEMLFLLK